MKNIAILGSTGSIGKNALKVVEDFPEEFRVVGLTADRNIDVLEAQINKFKPRLAACADKNSSQTLKLRLSRRTKILSGQEGVEAVATTREADIVLVAISGFNAVYPLLAAIKAGKQIALANKEALVSAGGLISKQLRRHKVKLIPIDSEQCAIFQCLDKENNIHSLKSIILTASGGPLYFKKNKDFKTVSSKDVLSHPRWSMGAKISVDSATLMNKGLEVIEARWLFATDVDKIKVLIHPQAAVHSMVEFIDGSILAQVSITDMRLPIQFAMSYPQRLKSLLPSLDFVKLRHLDFYDPDVKRFPSLALAYRAAKMKSSAATVLNAANEEAVIAFLSGSLNFSNIPKLVEHTLTSHRPVDCLRLEDIAEIDHWARVRTRELMKRI